MAGRPGFEPGTSAQPGRPALAYGLKARRSTWLSYRPTPYNSSCLQEGAFLPYPLAPIAFLAIALAMTPAACSGSGTRV